MATGRRLLGGRIRLAQRGWEDVAPELEFFLGRLWDSEANGIPSGFNDIGPQTLSADSITNPGHETTGWAAADHVHALDIDSIIENALAFAFLGY